MDGNNFLWENFLAASFAAAKTFLSTFWFLYSTTCGPITWCLTTNCGRHSSVDPSEPTILRTRVRIASKTSTLFQYFIVEMKNPDFHRTCHFSNGICKLERSWKMVEIVVSRNCIRLKRGRAWPIFQRRNCTCSNSTFVHYLLCLIHDCQLRPYNLAPLQRQLLTVLKNHFFKKLLSRVKTS